MTEKKLISFISIILFIICLYEYTLAGETSKIVILHTNDIHGHMLPYEDPKLAPPPEKIGGFQYLATLIEKERAKYPGKILLLDSGDISQGSIYSNLAYGIPMIELMNFLRYDVSAIGNHEFDWEEDRLKDMILKADFPVISANIANKDNGNFFDGAKPYIIKDVEGVRIGIIGLSFMDTTMYSADSVHNYNFLSPEETVKQYIPVLKFTHGVDLVIVLSHLGYQRDLVLASQVPGIDIIVGGHTHKAIEKPILIGKTIILQAGCYMAYLGELIIDFDMISKKIVNYEGKLIKILDNEIEADPEVSIMLDNYKKNYEVMAQKLVGETSVELTMSKVRESSLGNLVTDIIRQFDKSDIALINSGALREDIPVGPITMEKIYGVCPFNDLLVTMELTGKDIKDIFETNCSKGASILHVSGMKLKYDLTRAKGEQVDIFIGDKPINLNAVYKVATVDFLLQGGDGYEAFKRAKNINSGILLRDAIVQYFEFHSPVKAQIEGRIEIVQ